MPYGFTVKQLVQDVSGSLLQGDEDVVIKDFSTDSRYLNEGEMFIALVAERDGHEFIPMAVERGASALLVSDSKRSYPPGIPVILVEDTLFALGEIARHLLARHQIDVIAVTGSNGKTSTKGMLASIFSQVAPTLSNEGNYNNLIGVPWTIFRIQKKHRFAVLEMGMNAFGEISRLAEIAPPKVALITNVSTAHLEGLGSIEGVAQAKGELFQALPADGIAIINADDPLILQQAASLHCKKFFFSTQITASLPTKEIRHFVQLSFFRSLQERGFLFRVRTSETAPFEVRLPLVGRHQITNALGAIAVALAMKIPIKAIKKGLASIRPEGRRLRLVPLVNDGRLIDDSYNSNPNSCEVALRTLQDLSQGKDSIAILGDMLELGEHEIAQHEHIGQVAATSDLTALFTYGPRSKFLGQAASQVNPELKVMHFENIDELKKALGPYLGYDAWFLVKASRGMRLERISQFIEKKSGM